MEQLAHVACLYLQGDETLVCACRDVEEFMLAEALKQSLLHAEANDLPDKGQKTQVEGDSSQSTPGVQPFCHTEI